MLPVEARGQAYAELLGAGGLGRYLRLVSYERRRTAGRLLSGDLAAVGRTTGDVALFRRLASEAGARDYVSTLQHPDIQTYLPDDILTKVDRTSMAVSLEARGSLLGHVLVEVVATIPSTFKVRNANG